MQVYSILFTYELQFVESDVLLNVAGLAHNDKDKFNLVKVLITLEEEMPVIYSNPLIIRS